MDKLKVKHNHKLTDILKVLIFSIVMMAPLFAIATKCLYVICNKNAYLAYSETEKVENLNGGHENYNLELTNTWLKIKNNDQLEQGSSLNLTNAKAYDLKYNDVIFVYWKFENKTNTTLQTKFYSESTTYQATSNKNETTINNYNYTYGKATINYDHYETNIFLFGNGSNLNGTLINFGFIKLNEYNLQNKSNKELFDLVYNQEQSFFEYGQIEYENNKGTNLDKAFYQAVNELTQESTFNWTTNTGIYTTINAMFTGLEMPSNNALAIMLSYWMICMLIYLVIDIIVALITKMTHLFNE